MMVMKDDVQNGDGYLRVEQVVKAKFPGNIRTNLNFQKKEILSEIFPGTFVL